MTAPLPDAVGVEPNVARLLHENHELRKVAVAAARLRRLGQAYDAVEDAADTIARECPDMSRSGTGRLMAAAAYDGALNDFDRALADCALVFLHDPFAEEITLGPRQARSLLSEGECS